MEPEIMLNYSVQFNIGSGTFAQVFLAIHNKTGTKVAIKVISKLNCIDNERNQLLMRREIDIMKKLKHPFVCDLYEVVETEKNVYIVMEFAQNGTLLETIKSRGSLGEEDASIIFAQLLIVMKYLHNECKIAHRDIKAENIVFDSNRNIRIIDFGLSNSPDSNNIMQTQCGSVSYASPEMIMGQKYTYASDVWSLGILLYGMVCGHLPFQDTNYSRLAQKIVFKEVDYPSQLSSECIDLLKRILKKNQADRIPLNEIEKHPWISERYNSILNSVTEFHYNYDYISKRMQSYNLDLEQIQKGISDGVTDQDTITYNIICRENQIREFHQSMLNIYKLARKYSVKSNEKLPPLNPKDHTNSFKPRRAVIPVNAPVLSAKRKKMPSSLVFSN
ncbi:CAMK family protein kinase [Trichomonas vaginalis G3]|uniref:non-specific serine/threonine protein kinase n=1 Tax=Trichomonas vaginalis (strain ATCC PRA-98 / G3) TaxID=412133 RepID=A2F3L4_TRIV3|nr:protein serine/threonine kinase protein [Trichomonas vaginalis G3]EAY00482.1 CAMK family protein kinase [Trichomonas vaginalis G3]KAI5520559.1 protein serine/threonine kinase protein [Trichomonas vaginalis G3]|eukprot:XP_001313411.1 CAMK family protein kinase [Trichomonas vaginalis G3]